MLLKYAGALVLVLAIVVECEVGHQCVLCGGDCPSGCWEDIVRNGHTYARARAHARTRARTQATSTEAAALCSIDVTSENDECDDGCSDSAETCTIMDKALSSVIEASDRCRAFKSGMEELENSKQRQASCPCRGYEILCEYVTVSPGQEGSSSCLPKAAESGIMRG